LPLSEPVARETLHTRRIVLNGYRRADGLYDIEAQLTDTKTYGFANEDRGVIDAGEPLHGMSMRMTVDEDMMIMGFEAATDYSPYTICPQVTPNFARLVGLRIGRGFLRAAAERVGGVHGCTHLRELLQQMATVAFQTLYPVLTKRSKPGSSPEPGLLNTCYAYSADSSVVQRRWPEHYTGPNALARAGD
jgi:hypothetical protein